MFGLGKRARFVNYPNAGPSKSAGVEIVGESFYQANIKRMAKHTSGVEGSASIALQAEPKNSYDRDAIRVDWVNPDGSGLLQIGYIPATETARWHKVIRSAPKGSVWVWPAKVTGGGSGKHYGVIFYG